MTYFSKLKRRQAAVAVALVALCSASDMASAQATDPYLGQISLFGFTFCPIGWAEANGALLPISQNSALFALFGTTYGGNGISTFALPDLRGRVPMGVGAGPGLTPRNLGEVGGLEAQTLSAGQMPVHNHPVNATARDGNRLFPGGRLLGGVGANGSGSETIYSDAPATTTMSPTMVGNAGGGQPFATMDPFLVMRYCVATQGVFPSRP